MKINTKKIISLIVAGGLILAPQMTKAEETKDLSNIEYLILSNVKQDITFNDYANLVLNLKNEFDRNNINVELKDLYSLVYLANIDYINEDLESYLIQNNVINNDKNVILIEALNTLSMIATHNGNIYNDANCEKIVNEENLIDITKMLIDKNDKEVIETITKELNEFIIDIDSKEKYDNLYKFFTGFNRINSISINELSTGAKLIANTVPGSLYHSQISYMHNNIATNVELDILEDYLFDISNIMNVLNNTKCK